MLLIFLDTESTGLDPQKHRAVEIAFKIVDSVTFKVVNSYESIICLPREIWADADPMSLKVNGFTYEKILKGKTEKVIESEITTYFKNAKLSEKGGVFICQNPALDFAFFSKIVNVDLQRDYHWPYHWLDLASMYYAYRHFLNKNVEKESELSKDKIASNFSLPEEAKPHRAMNGVNHLILCYEKILLPAKDVAGW